MTLRNDIYTRHAYGGVATWKHRSGGRLDGSDASTLVIFLLDNIMIESAVDSGAQGVAGNSSVFPCTMSRMIRAFLCSSASLLTSLKTWSICSSVFPAVSGTQKKVKTNARPQKTAKKV